MECKCLGEFGWCFEEWRCFDGLERFLGELVRCFEGLERSFEEFEWCFEGLDGWLGERDFGRRFRRVSKW